MNKKSILKIKRAMNYEGLPAQKRMLKTFIKGYNELPHDKKREYIQTIEKTFNK